MNIPLLKPGKIKSWKEYHNEAWSTHSVYVRQRSASQFTGKAQCYTCREYFPWQEMDAGHYRHGVLDFDPMNVKPQCRPCNFAPAGSKTAYRMRLVDEYGEVMVLALERRADEALKGEKHSIERLKNIRAVFLEKIKKL